MDQDRLQAAYVAFLASFDSDRSSETLTFREEAAIRAAIRAYVEEDEDE